MPEKHGCDRVYDRVEEEDVRDTLRPSKLLDSIMGPDDVSCQTIETISSSGGSARFDVDVQPSEQQSGWK
jgi:hypothetical protein